MAMRSYGLDDEASVDAGRMLRSFLHGFVHLELGDGHPHPIDTDSSFDRIVSLLSTVLATIEPTNRKSADPTDRQESR
jgi:hypothetical protein